MTVNLLKDTRPDIVNLSKYSQRPGTEAAELNQIDKVEMKRRSKIIFELSNQISYENNKKWLGWTGSVLFSERVDGQKKGRNFAYKSIYVNEQVELGQVSQIQITDVTNHSLIGAIRS